PLVTARTSSYDFGQNEPLMTVRDSLRTASRRRSYTFSASSASWWSGFSLDIGSPLLARRFRKRLQLGHGVGAHVHRAELRPAHAAEGRGLVPLGRQRLVVHAAGGLGVHGEAELL